MTPPPWLSVIMPTFNGADYVAAALDGLACQDCSDIELVVVDDGSTDATPDIVASYADRIPLRTCEHTPQGNWVASTNEGIRHARGEFVSLLHQDDVWAPDRLASLRRATEHWPEVDFFFHPAWFIGPNGRRAGRLTCPFRREGVLPREYSFPRLYVQNFITVSACCFRRMDGTEPRQLDERLWFTADWKLWLSLLSGGAAAYIPDMLSSFRVHTLSQTATRSHNYLEFRDQYLAVQSEFSDRLRELSPHWRSVARAARLSSEVNSILAAASHKKLRQAVPYLKHLLCLDPSAWWRFAVHSRLHQRMAARLRAR